MATDGVYMKATDDRHSQLCWVYFQNLPNKGIGSRHIQLCHTKQLSSIESACPVHAIRPFLTRSDLRQHNTSYMHAYLSVRTRVIFCSNGMPQTTYFLKTSAAMGTVELTGLEMMATQALGQYFAMPSLKVFTIPTSHLAL